MTWPRLELKGSSDPVKHMPMFAEFRGCRFGLALSLNTPSPGSYSGFKLGCELTLATRANVRGGVYALGMRN